MTNPTQQETHRDIVYVNNLDEGNPIEKVYDIVDEMTAYCPKTNPGIQFVPGIDRETCCDFAVNCALRAKKTYDLLQKAKKIKSGDDECKIYLDGLLSACGGGNCEQMLDSLTNISKSPSYIEYSQSDNTGSEPIELFRPNFDLINEKYTDAIIQALNEPGQVPAPEIDNLNHDPNKVRNSIKNQQPYIG